MSRFMPLDFIIHGVLVHIENSKLFELAPRHKIV